MRGRCAISFSISFLSHTTISCSVNMATLGRTSSKLLKKLNVLPIFNRDISSVSYKNVHKTAWTTCACVFGGAIVLYVANRSYNRTSTVYALKTKQPEELSKSVKLTSRERRFIKFASAEHGGQLYMTPQDFLESVVEQEPRPRLKRRVLTTKEIEQLRDHTPPLKKGSSQMFRNMRDKGIISYTEYLFLLSILTKPASGFQIAFNMFDTDGNQRVDKNEFLVIQRLLGGSLKERKDLDPHSQQALLTLVSTSALKSKLEQKENVYKPSTMEKIFSFAWKGKRGIGNEQEEGKDDKGNGPQDTYVNDDQGLQRRHNVDTFLQVHFFGKKGTNDLKFEGFRQFMENLQTEVLELEFHEFSKGHETISEVDFAKILLRYTYLDTDEYDMYLDRLLDRVRDERGVTFDEFKTFCQFLNNLEDFTIAMRMYTLADHPISKDEFHRAVKICTGVSQSEHLVRTVFAIFDADGDGLLSYKEFIAIMKDRLHRGFKSYAKNEGWEAFKTCVKQEMKSAV
ncbi:PREDICTED: calcium uptake protein 3, mitochondrial isoform X1 [Papilio polytes]|uniref:calcium uptake protein 3, mitochondrial isoform X1 n=1 Tax=Papilio polytes TaxID=76194 RepID=UPI0006768BBD|nr:PREDICTED: calcium uptake protein 3, mitochondrial isoform X1 [Papilio polytes]